MIDDDSIFIDVIGTKFRREGMECQYAPNGAIGLEMLQKNPPPDIILLDISMPGMDGFEVLAKIKSIPAVANIPVIIFSNNFDGDNEKRGKDLGAAAFLEKIQVTPGLVVEEIRKLVSHT